MHILAAQSTFSMPAPDAFDASFCPEAGLDDSQDSQDSDGQFSSLMAGTSAVPGFDFSFDFDISTYKEVVFGESPSQQSTLSSSSLWDFTSKEDPSMKMGTDMQLRFPSIKVDGAGMPTEEEFLRAIMETSQSSPKTVSP